MAITGTHTVLLALDMQQQDTAGLLGFAIERVDPKENERFFLSGFKRFAYANTDSSVETQFSSHDHPVQAFLWEDYTAKPGYKYIYNLIPVTGKPKNLIYGNPCSIDVETEGEYGATHSVFFNRGVAGSLGYAKRFGNKKPSELTGQELNDALRWLSRGLKEAMVAFINRATGPTFSIRAAFYEFKHKEIMDALKDRKSNGIKVEIVYDHRQEAASNDAQIGLNQFPTDDGDLTKRTNEPKKAPSHNKFIILFEDGSPQAVWTGSTNITAKAIYGHCNTGHIINDPTVASLYNQYWEELQKDPDKTFRTITPTITPDLDPANIKIGTSIIFSPRASLSILKTYAALITGAKQIVCGMFPFSFFKDMKTAIDNQPATLEMILTDKKDKGLELKQVKSNIQIVEGTYFKAPLFNWLAEINAGILFNENSSPEIGTNYIHNKVLLIDPLTDDPIVIGGSANFSQPSINSNDENSLIIRGDKRVADIYFTEFYRIFDHYYIRVKTKDITDANKDSADNPLILKENSDWVNDYYKVNSYKTLRKEMFNAVKV